MGTVACDVPPLQVPAHYPFKDRLPHKICRAHLSPLMNRTILATPTALGANFGGAEPLRDVNLSVVILIVSVSHCEALDSEQAVPSTIFSSLLLSSRTDVPITVKANVRNTPALNKCIHGGEMGRLDVRFLARGVRNILSTLVSW